MQNPAFLQICIGIFFIVLSCSTILLVVFVGMVLVQFKRNLKAVEDFITKEVSATVEEIRLALNKINKIISNIDTSVNSVGSSITEIKNVIEKIISSTKNVTGFFNRSWIKIIISGVSKGWEFIRNRRKNNEGGKE